MEKKTDLGLIESPGARYGAPYESITDMPDSGTALLKKKEAEASDWTLENPGIGSRAGFGAAADRAPALFKKNEAQTGQTVLKLGTVGYHRRSADGFWVTWKPFAFFGRPYCWPRVTLISKMAWHKYIYERQLLYMYGYFASHRMDRVDFTKSEDFELNNWIGLFGYLFPLMLILLEPILILLVSLLRCFDRWLNAGGVTYWSWFSSKFCGKVEDGAVHTVKGIRDEPSCMTLVEEVNSDLDEYIKGSWFWKKVIDPHGSWMFNHLNKANDYVMTFQVIQIIYSLVAVMGRYYVHAHPDISVSDIHNIYNAVWAFLF